MQGDGFHFVWNELNLITVCLVLVLAAAFGVGLWRLWRWMVDETARMKVELPRAIAGELFTSREFAEMREKMLQIEVRVDHVESRLDAHIEEDHAPRI